MQLNAENILKLKLIDEIIPEPLGGAHKNPDQMANTLKASIVNNLKNLQLIDTTELLSRRYNRLMSYGEI
jgi:acetyl-CoA carboxylase carboxyl transferase subunit alpha